MQIKRPKQGLAFSFLEKDNLSLGLSPCWDLQAWEGGCRSRDLNKFSLSLFSEKDNLSLGLSPC